MMRMTRILWMAVVCSNATVQAQVSPEPFVVLWPRPAAVDSLCEDSRGYPCWVQTEEPPACYFSVPSQLSSLSRPYFEWSWTGSCPGGLAAGLWEGRSQTDVRRDAKGAFRMGKPHGHWDMGGVAGRSSQASYTFRMGELHGEMVRSSLSEEFLTIAQYVDGTLHGSYVGDNDGRREKGHYVDGLRQGEWVVTWGGWADLPVGARREDIIAIGSYLDGEKHGPWVEQDPNQQETGILVSSGNYVEGRRDGDWTVEYTNGCVRTVPYRRGARLPALSSCVRPDSTEIPNFRLKQGTPSPPPWQ